ncbi:hypothetical protein QQF64_031553 [Cirrhinus molitorella]|uniref:Uncharacterized protein n=1 Tax=Cirrhinus molitorella TaxID=172907 RepID=A0ABR3MXC3_9TELE
MEMEARMGKERESNQMREKERMRGEKKKKMCVPSSFTAWDVHMPEHVRRCYRSRRRKKAREEKRVNCKDEERE